MVLPATTELVTLVAEFTDGRVLSGETAIAAAGAPIEHLSLLPERPRCSPRVVDAIARADVIVAGPGSLYTSILPPLLVPDVADAIRASRAIRILVANLMTEPGETDTSACSNTCWRSSVTSDGSCSIASSTTPRRCPRRSRRRTTDRGAIRS